MKYFGILVLLFGISRFSVAQTEMSERAMIDFGHGLGFHAPDSAFGINIRMRMQNRMAINFTDDFSIEDIEARVSRARLRFDGYINNSKITYYLQLSFSRGDQDWENTHIANIVRDALIYYRFNPKFYIGFGQGKLPGNRQTIISSGQQQFYDRSNANANFSLDRDFGLFAYYKNKAGFMDYNLKAAVSSGDGRNQLKTNKGLMYTARVEFLPFGRFKKEGDFSEGDLEFEPTPKLSVGLVASFNDMARRTRGTAGTELYESRDLTSYAADLVLKYQGWALSSEYLTRKLSGSPLTYNAADSAQVSYVTIGQGFNTQLSYCFRNYWEIAARYSTVDPADVLRHLNMNETYYVLGVNKYLHKHLTKVQSFVGYRNQQSHSALLSPKSNFLFVFQVELGI